VLLAASTLALVFWALPSLAMAQACPPYQGVMRFPTIMGLEDPEDYCWEVQLFEGQELRQISATRAAVFYESGHEAFGIEATTAHDSAGTTVLTTLAVTDPNLITLTVHHRAGNPAAGGAPFNYPVSDGPGWEGGFISVQIQGPPDEAELREAELKAKPTPPAEEVPAPTCEVPVLQGRTVKAARRALLLAGCQLGPIRGHRRRGARIVKQYRPAFKTLPAGTEVGVKLGR
jgi:hypothetical protein